jgi:cytochrome c
MRTMLLALLVVTACGGGSKSTPPPAEPTPAPSEPAPAAEAPPPVETAPAESKPSPNDDVLAASALAEQYEAGKAVYTGKKCNTCHEDSGAGNAKSPAVVGEKALPKDPPKTAKLRKGVTFTTAEDVAGFVKKNMPIVKKGTPKVQLTDEETYAVVAWMLNESKVNLTKKLDASNAASVTLRP